MNTDFPDYLFCKTQNNLEYQVNEGKELCKSKNILFCGIVRNVEENLERNILRYKRTVEPFSNSRLFLYENDSTDNTVEILNRYKSDTIDFVSESRTDADYVKNVGTDKDPHHYHRCQALSECRNKYLSIIQERGWNEEYDLICLVDMDINGGWYYDGFYQSIFLLEQLPDAACMSAYGVLSDFSQKHDLEMHSHEEYLFYDSFAFRPIGVDPKIHKSVTAFFNPIHYCIGEEPEEVISNFNGMSIYKSKHFTSDKKYKTNNWKEGFVDSEHIYFHQQIRESGDSIYINPSLLVSYSHHKFSRE